MESTKFHHFPLKDSSGICALVCGYQIEAADCNFDCQMEIQLPDRLMSWNGCEQFPEEVLLLRTLYIACERRQEDDSLRVCGL